MTTERNESVSVAVHAAVHAIGSAVDDGTMTWDAAVARLTTAFPAINLSAYSKTLNSMVGGNPRTAFAVIMWAYADALSAVGLAANDAAFENFLAAQRSGDPVALKAASQSTVAAWDVATARAETAALAVFRRAL